MQRHFLFAIFGIVVGVGAVLSAPARPLYEPPAPPPPRVVIELNGTAWLGPYAKSKRIYLLEPDGTVSYRSAVGKAAGKGKVFTGRGTWRLEGDELFFEHYINPQVKLLEFRGIVRDANTIVGEVNMLQTGEKFPATLERWTVPGN
jgi:hypothetical protein